MFPKPDSFFKRLDALARQKSETSERPRSTSPQPNRENRQRSMSIEQPRRGPEMFPKPDSFLKRVEALSRPRSMSPVPKSNGQRSESLVPKTTTAARKENVALTEDEKIAKRWIAKNVEDKDIGDTDFIVRLERILEPRQKLGRGAAAKAPVRKKVRRVISVADDDNVERDPPHDYLPVEATPSEKERRTWDWINALQPEEVVIVGESAVAEVVIVDQSAEAEVVIVDQSAEAEVVIVDQSAGEGAGVGE